MRPGTVLGILSLGALALVGLVAASAPVGAAEDGGDSSYEELIALFADWRAFERPAPREGGRHRSPGLFTGRNGRDPGPLISQLGSFRLYFRNRDPILVGF